MKLQCLRCERNYSYNRGKGCCKRFCGSCRVFNRRTQIKEKMLAYAGGKCKRCGYDKCSSALVFHHLNPKKKDFALSNAYAKRWSIINAR